MENIIGIKTNVPENTLSWHIKGDDKHGINNYHFGDLQADLITFKDKKGYQRIEVKAGCICTQLFSLPKLHLLEEHLRLNSPNRPLSIITLPL